MDEFTDSLDIKAEPDGIEIEPDGMKIESDGMIESDGIEIEPDGIKIEWDGMKIEPDGIKIEPEGFKEEPDDNDAVSISKDTTADGLIKDEVTDEEFVVPISVVDVKRELEDGCSDETVEYSPNHVHKQDSDERMGEELANAEIKNEVTTEVLQKDLLSAHKKEQFLTLID